MAKSSKKGKRNEEDELLDMLNEQNDDSGDGDEGDGDDKVTEAQINKMNKKKLLAFIEKEGLDIDSPDGKKVGELRELVVAEYFESEGEAEEESAEEGEEVSEEDVRKMKKADLITLIEEEGLEITGYKKMTVPQLKDSIVEVWFAEDLPNEDELAAMSKKELIEVVSAHSLEVDGAEDLGKKKLLKAVLAALPEEAEEEPEPEPEEKPKEKKGGKKADKPAKEEEKPVAKKVGKGKRKGLDQNLPIKSGSKRYNAIATMMEKSRTMDEHREAAEKSHKKAKGAVRGNSEYKTVMDRNLFRLVQDQFGGVFEESTDDGGFVLLGFDDSRIAEKPSKNKDKPAAKEGKKNKGKKGGKKNKNK